MVLARQRQMRLRLDICKQEEEKEEVPDADAADVLHFLLMERSTIGAGLI